MVDLVGTDKITEVIRKSGRNSFQIMRPGQGLQNPPVFEEECANSDLAANKFEEWATLFGGNGNAQRYEIHLFCSEDTPQKKRSTKLQFTFQLNPAPGQYAPENKDAGREITINAPKADMSGYVPRSEMEGAIERAIEKVQTNHAIQALTAQVASLSRQLEEMEYEDLEEEEEEEEENENELDTKRIERITGAVRDTIKTAKDAYLEIKGSDGKLQSSTVDTKLKVAGPEEEVVTAAPGEMPAYLKQPVHEDQQIKINKALAELYKKDGHLGDDLLLIAKMAREKPKKFEGLILTLREE